MYNYTTKHELTRIFYSLFYGQDFQDDYKHAIAGPYAVRNVLQLSQIPMTFDESDVSNIFEESFPHQSDVNVHQIVNLVYVFRTLV